MSADHPSPRTDAVLAGVVAACALAVFIVTMYPGLGGGGDSAKFQYLGHVLGTAHPPGYPLYVEFGWVFSHLPIGTLAYRANLMAGCFGALAAALLFLVLRRLGCHRAVALAVAFAMAFDRYVWAKSVVAEVYALAAVFAAGTLLLILRWSHTRRDRDLFAAAACFSLSLGNHLTLATLGPVLVLYVVLVDWRTAIRPRTLIVCGALFMAGLAQYLFVLIRTLQGAAYVEARATNLGELFNVMRASRYSYQMFSFGAGALWHERVPLIAGLFRDEFGIVGAAFLFFGVIVATRRRWRDVVLLVLGPLAVVFLTLNVDSDSDGFLVPAFALAWPLAGLGFEAVRSALAGRNRLAGWLAIAAIAAFPVAQISANYRINDHHRRTYEIRYFGALFDAISDRTAIVSESYAVDQLVLYKLLGEGAAGRKRVEQIAPDTDTVNAYWRRGYTIYAFGRARGQLAALGFRFVTVQLVESRPAGRDGQGGRALSAIDMGPMPLFRVAAPSAEVDVGNVGWRDVTEETAAGRLLGVIDDYRAYDASMTFYLASATALTPRLVIAQGSGLPRLDVRTLRSPSSAGFMAAAVAPASADAFDWSALPPDARYLYRAEIRVNDQGDFSTFAIDLGGVPSAAFASARVDRDNPKRARVHSIPKGPWDLFAEPGKAAERVTLGDEPQEALLGQGWHGPEREGEHKFRWMAAREAGMALPFAEPGPLVVEVTARPMDRPDAAPVRLGLSVNDTALDSKSMQPGWNRYEWAVPASAWRPGLNAVVLQVSGLATPASRGGSADVRLLGAAVSEIVFRRQ
jgi:hypothetical protein